MRSLTSKVGSALPAAVVSAVVVESAARFRDSVVVQLLDPQSAVSHLLLKGTLFLCSFTSSFNFYSLLFGFRDGCGVAALVQVIGRRSRWTTPQGRWSTAVWRPYTLWWVLCFKETWLWETCRPA